MIGTLDLRWLGTLGISSTPSLPLTLNPSMPWGYRGTSERKKRAAFPLPDTALTPSLDGVVSSRSRPNLPVRRSASARALMEPPREPRPRPSQWIWLAVANAQPQMDPAGRGNSPKRLDRLRRALFSLVRKAESIVFALEARGLVVISAPGDGKRTTIT